MKLESYLHVCFAALCLCRVPVPHVLHVIRAPNPFRDFWVVAHVAHGIPPDHSEATRAARRTQDANIPGKHHSEATTIREEPEIVGINLIVMASNLLAMAKSPVKVTCATTVCAKLF